MSASPSTHPRPKLTLQPLLLGRSSFSRLVWQPPRLPPLPSITFLSLSLGPQIAENVERRPRPNKSKEDASFEFASRGQARCSLPPGWARHSNRRWCQGVAWLAVRHGQLWCQARPALCPTPLLLQLRPPKGEDQLVRLRTLCPGPVEIVSECSLEGCARHPVGS